MSHHFTIFLKFLLLVDELRQRIDFDAPTNFLFQLVNRLMLAFMIDFNWGLGWRVLLLLRAITRQLDCGVLVLT